MHALIRIAQADAEREDLVHRIVAKLVRRNVKTSWSRWTSRNLLERPSHLAVTCADAG